MKFEIYKAADGWRWRLKAANGEIVASGESYKNKGDCVTCVETIQANAADAYVVTIASVRVSKSSKSVGLQNCGQCRSKNDTPSWPRSKRSVRLQ